MELELSYNQLENLPSTIGQLTSLRWLYLMVNKLTAIPNEFVGLQELKKLKIIKNMIPDSELQKLKWLLPNVAYS